MTIELGVLEKVELREMWINEGIDFTPWLAMEDNLALLGEAIGLELEFEAQEVAVGPYSADILARDTSTDKYVVIENQLDKTDHKHLGQAIMYGAVLDASAVVWIASDFTDEHRKALDWLNNHTDDSLNFFGVQIELWKIGDSLPAPRLNVVSRPTKVVGPPPPPPGVSPSRKLQFDFWTQVQDKLKETGIFTSLRTPQPRYWYNVAIGRSHCVISCIANTHKNRIGVRLYLSHHVADQVLAALDPERERIQSELGPGLLWNPNPEKQDKIIKLQRDADLNDQSRWPEYVDWMVQTIIKFRNTFRDRVKNLDLTQPDEELDDPDS